MSENRDRESDHRKKETVDTVKALIEVYKSAFGETWMEVFQTTVKVAC